MPNCDFDIDILEEGNNKVALADFEYIYNRKDGILWWYFEYIYNRKDGILSIFTIRKMVYYDEEDWDITMKER